MPGFRMTHRSREGRPGSDRGAVSALVAVVLAGGVLLGMATLVVDVGRLYAEREQLQSGADAAAWALAEGCVQDPAGCADQAILAGGYADANAADGTAAVSVICGSDPAELLPGCPPPADNRTACLGDAPEGVSYVEVRTHTRLPDGTTLLPPAFAGALAGDQADGVEVASCARAAWGPPANARGLAVTFSVCEWQQLTADGTAYWPQPSEGTPPPEAERLIYLKDNTTATCGAGPSGWDAPGGFGWLDDATSTCETTVSATGAYPGNTGNSPSQPCRDALEDLREQRRMTLVPVYDGVLGQGADTTYHLAGFAAFVLTGYDLSGPSQASWLTGRRSCGTSQRCLFGYFTRGLVPATGTRIGGPDLGVSIVNLVG